jgi:hypothetical protein
MVEWNGGMRVKCKPLGFPQRISAVFCEHQPFLVREKIILDRHSVEKAV